MNMLFTRCMCMYVHDSLYVWIYLLCFASHISVSAITSIDCMGVVNPGQGTTLICTITGTVKTGIIWLRPNSGSPEQVIECNTANTVCVPTGSVTGYSAVTSISSVILTIHSFNAAKDAGTWICQDGPNGNIATCDKMVSKGPDSIRFSLTSPRTIIEGQTLSVRCSADCVPPCSFSWKQGNTHISSNSLLTQKNIRRVETRFTCTATNTFTSTSKTRDFQLTVYYPPTAAPVISGTTFPVNEGDTVTLHCSTTGGNPKPTLSWSCSGVSGSASCSDSGETRTCTISFTANRNQNNKNCVCTPTWQNGGYTQSKSRQMNVYYLPTITSMKLNSQSTKITVDELTPMTLSCDVDSNPASDIKLLNTSQTLYEVKNSKTAEYTWNEAGCLDTGRYTCEAENNIKSAVSQSVQLVVKCSPRLDHRVPFQARYATTLGGYVSLMISVIANPAPTFTWYRLTGGKRTNLGSSNPAVTTDVSAVGSHVLSVVQLEDCGIYQVSVLNLVVNFTIVLKGSPNIPSGLKVKRVGSSSISVAWTEEFNGHLPQTFLVQYRTYETSEWMNVTGVFPERGLHTHHTVVISNLQPMTRYVLRVMAYNTEGNKGFTTEQDVLTEDSSPEKDSLLGAGIGIGVGIMVVIILIVGGVIFTYYRMKSAKSKTAEKTYDTRQFDAGERESSHYDELGETRGNESHISTNVPDAYSPLETRTDRAYEMLAVYENASEIKQD